MDPKSQIVIPQRTTSIKKTGIRKTIKKTPIQSGSENQKSSPLAGGPSKPSPPICIPDRRASKGELLHRRVSIQEELQKARKRMRPMSSYDSSFWSAQAQVAKLEQERLNAHCGVRYYELVEKTGEILSQDGWNAMEEAKELLGQYNAYRVQEEIAQNQAQKLGTDKNLGRQLREAFVKLFNTSKLGFGVVPSPGVGRRDTNDQSKMRQELIRVYHPATWTAHSVSWDPVLGIEVDRNIIKAAHLFPWRCIDFMDAIFGLGAKEEIFTHKNGLLLHKDIEDALDKGLIAIVPNVRTDADAEDLQAWEKNDPKEYKTIILDWNSTRIREELFFRRIYGVERLEELHNKPLNFLTDARPRSRYVWWTFLAGITKLSWRQKQDDKTAIQLEVAKSTRYWGTRGKYVKENQLLGFIEELGQDVCSILENKLEEEDCPQPELEGVAILASETIRKGNQEDSDEGGDEGEDDDEGEENETGDEAEKLRACDHSGRDNMLEMWRLGHRSA